uniref:Uncharacterized protein n=1 Tax=Arundo donax TaxID=35708 RepID=A0A0A8Y1K6_ARUDO
MVSFILLLATTIVFPHQNSKSYIIATFSFERYVCYCTSPLD